MELQNIAYEKSEGVGIIKLNRPDKLNAITFEMLDGMWEVLQEIMVDNEVRVILLKGEDRYFCAGADLGILGDDEAGDLSHTPAQVLEFG